jgi:NDP-sugar pyrophosphorylase family protein
MKSMVLAAGEGTRLRPLTLTTPKAMVEVGGRPLLAHTLKWLKSYGITEVGINLHYLGSKIIDYFGDGSSFELKITWSPEDSLLGTAGGVRRIASLLDPQRSSEFKVQLPLPNPDPTSSKFAVNSTKLNNLEPGSSNLEPFVVAYGDILTDLDISAMAAFHARHQAVVTIALSPVPNPHEKGIVELDPQGRILSFTEKPAPGTEKGNLASGGIYILEPEVLDYIPPSGPADFGFDVFPALLRAGRPLYGYVLPASDYLLDIGSLENYDQANKDYTKLKTELILNYRRSL